MFHSCFLVHMFHTCSQVFYTFSKSSSHILYLFLSSSRNLCLLLTHFSLYLFFTCSSHIFSVHGLYIFSSSSRSYILHVFLCVLYLFIVYSSEVLHIFGSFSQVLSILMLIICSFTNSSQVLMLFSHAFLCQGFHHLFSHLNHLNAAP